MRYAIVSKGLTISQLQDEVRRCGGRNLKVALASKQIFCDLDDAGKAKLETISGLSIKIIGTVKAPQVITPGLVLQDMEALQPVYAASQGSLLPGWYELRQAFTPPVTGTGFTAAVLDSGIRSTHRSLKDKVLYERNYTSSPDCDDHFDHGCISGDAHIITSHCGIQTIRRLYEDLEQKYGASGGVINIPNNEPIYAVGFKDGKSVRTRVHQAHKIRISGDVYRVKTCTGEILTTPWHPCLTRHPTGRFYYRRADEIQAKLHYLTRANCPAGVTDEYKQLAITYGLPHYGQKAETVLVNEKVGYILGLIVADGHISDYRVNNVVRIFCANEDEAKIISEAASVLAKPRVSRSRTCWTVGLGSRAWAITVAAGLPKGNKSRIVDVPELIGKSPVSVQLAFLAGVIDGDGNFHNTHKFLRIVTASQSFAEHLVYLINSLGGRAYSYKEHHGRVRNYRGHIVRSAPYYYVVQTRGSAERYLLELVSPYLKLKQIPEPSYGRRDRYTAARRVRSVEKEFFDGYFYDLTTDTSNYLAGNRDFFVIHNTGVAFLISGGRHAAGEESGIAPDGKLVSFKVLNDNGVGSVEDVVMALDDIYAITKEQYDRGLPRTDPQAINCVNLSLGTEDDGDPDNPMRLACRALIDDFILHLTAAAGNAGPAAQTVTIPAVERDVWGVGVMTFSPLDVWSHSSRGPTKEGLIKPDIVFVGVDILTASAASDEAFIVKSGTSFAAPLIAGAGADLWELFRRMLGEDYVPDRAAFEGFFPLLCYKPEEAPREKDNSYGFGLPLGTAVVQIFRPTGAAAIQSMVETLTPVLGIGMVGMMMSSMAGVLR